MDEMIDYENYAEAFLPGDEIRFNLIARNKQQLIITNDLQTPVEILERHTYTDQGGGIRTLLIRFPRYVKNEAFAMAIAVLQGDYVAAKMLADKLVNGD